MKTYYKIVEKKDDGIYFLFHGIGGTRKITPDKWIRANIKEGVRDGLGTRYTSGIHVLDSLEETLSYMKKFRKKDRIIVVCHCRGLRRKAHSRHRVFLAREMKVIDLVHF